MLAIGDLPLRIKTDAETNCFGIRHHFKVVLFYFVIISYE
jgi:hypothetical protein